MLVPLFPKGGRPRAADGARALPPLHTPEDRLNEAVGLAEAIDLEVRASRLVPLVKPRPATLFGSGKVAEIGEMAGEEQAGLVIVDHAVTAIQQRNLERAWNVKVLDRTGLILEIFGRRARTREGRLQVELAHLTYQKSRLVRSWTHLERQRGGFGFFGGPGETQIEADRRMIGERIHAIRKELDGVARTRALHRVGRRRVPYPVVAIVGYTNAGKSTVFNRMTGAGVAVEDRVFATLDPTMREMKLDGGRRIVLSDTVGFISDLPTMLVAAFRATLEEVAEADLILHVRDISHPESEAQRRDVEAVLADLGAAAAGSGSHLLEVWNKIDRVGAPRREEIEHAAQRTGPPAAAIVSALTGEGLERLRTGIAAALSADDEILALTLPVTAGALGAWLHAHTEVLSRETSADGETRWQVRVAPSVKGRLLGLLANAGRRAPTPDP
ncbi:MAG: GTPase HflX [Hyphomicrobiaceae bacterium]